MEETLIAIEAALSSNADPGRKVLDAMEIVQHALATAKPKRAKKEAEPE